MACCCCYVGIGAGLGSLYLSWGHKLRFWRSQTSLYICKDAEWEVILCRCLSGCPHFIWTEEIKHSLASLCSVTQGQGEPGRRAGGGNISQEILRECLQRCVTTVNPCPLYWTFKLSSPIIPFIWSLWDKHPLVLGSLAGVSRPWWYLWWPRRFRRAEGSDTRWQRGRRDVFQVLMLHHSSLYHQTRPGVVTRSYGRVATLRLERGHKDMSSAPMSPITPLSALEPSVPPLLSAPGGQCWQVNPAASITHPCHAISSYILYPALFVLICPGMSFSPPAISRCPLTSALSAASPWWWQ